jgi:hypothetical protein
MNMRSPILMQFCGNYILFDIVGGGLTKMGKSLLWTQGTMWVCEKPSLSLLG